jgi:hypothetical protein
MRTIAARRLKRRSLVLAGLFILCSGNGLSFRAPAGQPGVNPAPSAATDGEPQAASKARPAGAWTAIWKEQRTLRGHASGVWCVAFSPDGKLLATGSGGYLGEPGELKTWDPISGREKISVATQRSVRWVRFAPDSKTLATAEHENQGAARLRDAATGRVLHTLVGHHKPIDTLAFSPDGKRLATASWDKTVKIWNAQTGTELATLQGHPGEVYPLAFSPDGRLVLSGDGSGVAILWDADTGKMIRDVRGHTKVVQAVAFAKDGKTVATAGWDKTIKLWDTATGAAVAVLKGHTLSVLDLMFSPDGRTLASVSGVWGGDQPGKITAGEVILWDIAARKEFARLAGHSDRVFGVAFSADGKLLATASWDKTVKVWRGLQLRNKSLPLSVQALRKLWDEMASTDFVQAGDAVEVLASAPHQAIPFLVERLRQVRPADSEKRIATLITQLDSNTFKVREKAVWELTELGPSVVPQLQAALAKGISLETRRRIDCLLEKIKVPELTPEQRRLQWTITALELARTVQARKALEELANGGSGAWLAQEARASLKRLAKPE